MSVVDTAWLIGSVASLPALDITLDGNVEAVAAGDYYLYDPTDALSLLAQVEAAMTAAGVADASAVLAKNRKVLLSSSGVFTLAWPDTQLRHLLGFTAGGVGATSYIAADVSPLLWSPATTEISRMSPLGTAGHKVFGTHVTVSSLDGTTEATQHGSRTYQRFEFTYVNQNRVQTSTEANGEFVVWWREVGSQMARWKLYRRVGEDTAALTAVTLGSPLGPYVYTVGRGTPDWEFERSRGFELVDARNNIEIPCHIVPEFT